MKIVLEKSVTCVVLIIAFFHIITGDPDTQLTYNNTLFGYFSNSPPVDWYTAQLRCLDWGGNLATIKSKEEDSLLYYSSTDRQRHFACYIGLNDILNEAGTDGSAYTWVDGSSSEYRNFGTGLPSSGADRDCVRFRYKTGTGVLSDGWNNQVCSILINCHFCSKPATSGDCDLIYNSSCYRVFEVSTPINWLDAQSSCAIWGGDLTSITTERENNYLNTMITSSVGNCWIGLNDRDVEGTYTWIDSTTYTQPNFVSTLSNNGADDCVRITNSGDWESVSCMSTLSSFVCKASSLIAAVQIFGELTNEGLNFQTINENTFLFNSLTLACGGEESITISWKYSQISDFSTSEELTATSSSVETGLSWLKVDNSKQGYYQCQIGNEIRYTIGLYDQTTTTVAVLRTTYNYTVGIDRVDASLLCNPNNDDVLLESLMWGIEDGDANDVVEVYTHEFPNPADLNTVFSNVGGGLQTFHCFYRMSPITLLGSLQLALKDPATITINYQGSTTMFSDANNPMFPSAQEIGIPLGTTDIRLTCSLPECVWKISNDASVTTTGTYIIAEISNSYTAEISLMRITNTGVNYTTAHIRIHTQAVMQSASSIALVAVIIVLGLLICLVTMAILIPLIIYCCVKKRNIIKRPKVSTKNGYSGYENLSKLPSSSKEYIDLPVNSNPQYMTIDETSMIPLESENEQKHREYVNLADESSHTQPNEENNETINEPSSELNPIVPYEGYVPMSSVKEEKKFVQKFIPIKEFPAIYQQLVASGINKNSLFSVEFTNLTEYSRMHYEFETDEALKVENNPKNPLRDIIPFDENRIVLNSPYFDCNYINASYINDYQFIASIHPTKETHRDFLQMIYQTEASMVIMLTTRREKAKIISGISNRVCYWPKKEEPIECEPFLITLINSTETAAFIKQEISVKNTLDKKEHTFIHCISPIWNEDSTVAEMSPALTLLSRIQKQIQDVSSKPIIIHCEDGISKTGILLSGINCVKELTHKNSINIFNSVKNLRRQRMKMVPTLACYTTCYSLMNEYCSIHL